MKLSNAIDRALAALFAAASPASCPADPVEKQKHLRALALARLIDGDHTVVRAGVAEFVAVIDVDQPNGNGSATVDWGIPFEVPARVIADLIDAGAAKTTAVVGSPTLRICCRSVCTTTTKSTTLAGTYRSTINAESPSHSPTAPS